MSLYNLCKHTDWFQIGKGVHQSCILSPCLFNLYAEYIMKKAGLEEAPWSLPKPMSINSVMPSNHLILCRPLRLLPPIPPSIRVFSNESTHHRR